MNEVAIHFGKYELLSRINVGGMAEIVRACDTSMPSQPLVAVKRILPHLCEDEQYTAMFMDESRVLTQLDHPNIIHAFEIGEIDSTPYIALDYVDGQDARSLFQRVRAGDERCPISVACYVIACVCDGLHHAHEQKDQAGRSLGLVHRDVSLPNILLSYAGDVKITDFGIAASSQNLARTEAGIVKGKFGYMSPEQIKGSPLDRRSDVFGAGICLYELLTGERLFAGDNDYKAIERVRNVEIEPPSVWNRNIPSQLERIVLQALAKQPRDRFKTALELRQALLAFMAAGRERCTREDLGLYLRTVFADEYEQEHEEAEAPAVADRSASAARAAAPSMSRSGIAGSPGPASAAAGVMDGVTGLMAFENLEPVSEISFPDSEPDTTDFVPPGAAIPSLRDVRTSATLPPAGLLSAPVAPPGGSAPRMLPIVPPIVPHRDSVPGTYEANESFAAALPRAAAPSARRPQAQRSPFVPEARPLQMDWDEHEPTTVNQGFEHIRALPDPFNHDDEVTRMRLDDAPSTPIASLQSGPFPPSLELPKPMAAIDLPPPASTLPTLKMWPPRALRTARPITLMVGSTVVLFALALGMLLARDRGAGTVRLTTDPGDAIVTVNGRRAPGSSSPYVLSDLDPSNEHMIAVDKPGYRGWSTSLRLRGDQVLDLPLVRLEPVAPVASAVTAAPIVTPIVSAAQLARAAETASQQARAEKRAETRAARAEAKRAEAASRPKPEPKARPERASVTEKVAAAKPSTATPTSSKPPAASGGGMGSLRVNTRPWSRVMVDGRLIGNTPQMNIQLSEGTHKLTFVNPEFGITKDLTVQIKAGEMTTRVLTLE